MRPLITVHLEKIYENAKIINNTCKAHGIDVTAVTKLHGCDLNIIKTLKEAGITSFGDSRIENLKNIKDDTAKKTLIRIPSISTCDEVVMYSDCSLISEYDTALAINEASKIQKKLYDLIVMVDIGDLREGYFEESDLYKNISLINNLSHVNLKGIGTNLTCYGGVLPDIENMNRLVKIKENIEGNLNIKLDTISGGNSTSYTLVREGAMPKGINNLRIGDSIYFGRDCTYRKHIEGMHKDSFILTAEIIELKEKPSIPIGNRGFSALNSKPEFLDKGIRKRAICSVGKQDIDLDIFPLDEGLEILGSSSDHLIVDVTSGKTNYKVGDKISFYMYYTAALRGFTSKYTDKEYTY